MTAHDHQAELTRWYGAPPRWPNGHRMRHHTGDVWLVLQHLGGEWDDYRCVCIEGREAGRITTLHAEYIPRSFEPVGLALQPVGDLDRAGNALCGWLLQHLDEEVTERLAELHPDTWGEIAEVAVRAARGERDDRPRTMRPELPR